MLSEDDDKDVNIMDNYSMILPSYSIGSDVYSKIPQFCAPYGKTAVMIGGHKALAAAEDKIRASVSSSGIEIIDRLWYGGECTYENADMLADSESVKNADMIFAVGGGKALDTCKCLADKIDKPVFTFPTIASNCACCTSVSIMYRPDGTFIEPYFFLNPAVHAFIDTDIMCAAPEKYIWAGMGDTIAKYYECTISARGDELEHFTALGVAMSSMCVDPIVKYGAKALSDNKMHVSSYEYQQTVLAITATTALVSIFLTRDHTPDYNSGAAHALFYAMTSISEIEENHLHGEVVGFGVLILLLVDKQIDEFKRIYDFNKSVGLPTSLDEIELSLQQLYDILPIAAGLSDIKHYPYAVTVDMFKEAFAKLDEYNKLCEQ